MLMESQRPRAARSRAAARPVVGGLSGFELFILGLIAAMVLDVALFVWLVVHEFAR